MKIIHLPNELPADRQKVCLAIGVFDGVHLGHQQVIHQTIGDARQHEALAIAVTFDRHPNVIVAPDRVPPLIYSLPQKLRVIESLGADVTWVIRFDQPFSQISGEEFIRQLARDFKLIHSICVGNDFSFGRQRSGNVALLRQLGAELKFVVQGLAAVSLDGHTVSSTRIREAIREGNLDEAGQMLGRPYSLTGPVERGNQLGRQLGFPTANINVQGLVLPPQGVYAVHARTSGQTHRGVMNIGRRPTFHTPDPPLRVEVHLLDFQQDLYGTEMEITFVSKIREETKFASLDELKQQIGRDIDRARALF